MKSIIFIIGFFVTYNCLGQGRTKVLPLGTFHFKYPNNDVQKIEKEDQINILSTKYQNEIQTLVNALSAFNPTHIVIEREPYKQTYYDSLYTSYLNKNHVLDASEEQQIGFRIAKKIGLKKLYCVDVSARYYSDIDSLLNYKNYSEHEDFMNFFYTNPDSIYHSMVLKNTLKDKGLIEYLKEINSKEVLKNDLGIGYLTGIFKYETESKPYLGADFVSGWWFNRNLRIFRNIQKIGARPGDRILIIYGVGHMNLLNFFFECSPEFELTRVSKHLLDQ